VIHLFKMKEDNFIGIFENSFSKEFCEKYINIFNRYKETNLIRKRQSVEVEDQSIFITQNITDDIDSVNMKNYSREFTEIFFKLYDQYANKFSILNRVSKHAIYDIKIQKTSPGQGYHIWHTEHEDKVTRDRLLAFTLYLNTVENGGETEFLYLKKRIQPKQGTCLIWPSGFTHTHRGNSPLDQDKYIITGWLEYGV